MPKLDLITQALTTIVEDVETDPYLGVFNYQGLIREIKGG